MKIAKTIIKIIKEKKLKKEFHVNQIDILLTGYFFSSK